MFLALRELRRARVRFALLTGAVGLLVFLILFQQTLLTNLLGFFTGALEHQSGTVVVYGDDARRNLAGSVVTPDQVEAVGRVDGVADSGPLYQATFTTEPAGEREAVDAAVFGYRLGGPGEPTTVEEGRLPRRDGEAVASAIDAENGFAIGDRVTIVDADPDGPGLEVEIVGLAEDARFSVQPVLFVSEETFVAARTIANPDAAGRPVFASAALAIPAGGTTPEALARRVDQAVPGVEALDRQTAVDSLPGVQPVRQSFATILGLTFLVVTLVTGFFFLILTVQKAAALTLLRALGVGGAALVRALLVQVLVVVVGGIAVGVALLALASAGSSPEFPITVDARLVSASAAVVLVLGVLASLVAVRRVLRIDPIQATTRPALGGLG